VTASQFVLACPYQSTEVLRSGTWATIRYAIKTLGRDHVIIIPPVEGQQVVVSYKGG
jgi:hypothetical protein